MGPVPHNEYDVKVPRGVAWVPLFERVKFKLNGWMAPLVEL